MVFTAITDPVGAKLDSGNITGTSDVLPVEGQLELIRALQPEAKTIGIVYTTSEANSVYSVKVYEEKAAEYGFTIASVGVTAQSEVTQAVDTLIAKGWTASPTSPTTMWWGCWAPFWKRPMRRAFLCTALKLSR